jgi:hypothetical protein
MPVAICLIIFGSHVNILFIMKVTIPMLIEWSYRNHIPHPANNHVEYSARTLISYKHMCFWCQFLDAHLATYPSKIGVQVIVVFDLGTSTLMTSGQISEEDERN